MADIHIQHINAAKVRLATQDESILEDLYRTLRFKEPNFAPNKFSKWDGEVRLFDKGNKLLNYGLIYHLLELAKTRGWTLSLDDSIKQDLRPVTKEQIEDWCNNLDIRDGGNKISPYDYQREGLYLAIRYSRITLLAATSAGKSLLQYMIIRMLQQIHGPEHKILLVVPSINLVSQMKADFANYSSHDNWDANENCHCVAEGVSPYSDKPVIISTYQSLMNLDASYFQQYHSLIGDECHLYSAKSLEKIANNCVNAYNRVGLTGTLKQEKLHPLQVSQHFGIIKRIVSTKQLQDAGRAAKTQITMAMLSYTTEERKKLFESGDYQKEIEFLIGHSHRNRIITNLAAGLKGNTLMLFDRVDAHLEVIVAELQKRQSNRTFLVIHGEVGNKERDIIKKATEAGDDITILATFGCMSTGVSIKKLHNLVFCHPSKSIIRVLQSLGRLLRLHDSKDVANIYDLVDDLSYMGKSNHALRHSRDRYGFYTDEGHPIRSLKLYVGEGLSPLAMML